MHEADRVRRLRDGAEALPRFPDQIHNREAVQAGAGMNRFYDCAGDVSIQLAPWESISRGLDPSISMFLLERELRFRSTIAGGDIVVRVGFFSDLASIPR